MAGDGGAPAGREAPEAVATRTSLSPVSTAWPQEAAPAAAAAAAGEGQAKLPRSGAQAPLRARWQSSRGIFFPFLLKHWSRVSDSLESHRMTLRNCVINIKARRGLRDQLGATLLVFLLRNCGSEKWKDTCPKSLICLIFFPWTTRMPLLTNRRWIEH